MKFHRKILLIILTFLFAVSASWNVSLYFFPEKTTLWHYLFNTVYGMVYLFGGVVSIYYAFVFSLRSNLGKMLLFLGSGLVSFDVGLWIWVYYNLILKVSIPFPSWADASFMLFYPIMFVGVFYLLMIYQSLMTNRVVRDSVIITIASAFLVFGLFSRPDLSANLPLIQRIINIGYPMGDVVTLAAALIALRIGGGKLHPSIYIFSFGMLLQTAADLLFTYRNANGTYWNGDISDTLYACSAYFMSIGLFEIINNLQQASPVAATTQPVSVSPSPVISPSQPQPISQNSSSVETVPPSAQNQPPSDASTPSSNGQKTNEPL